MVNSLSLFSFLHQPTTLWILANIDFEPDQLTLYICLLARQIYMDVVQRLALLPRRKKVTVRSQNLGPCCEEFSEWPSGILPQPKHMCSELGSRLCDCEWLFVSMHWTAGYPGCHPGLHPVTAGKDSSSRPWVQEEARREDGFLWMLCFTVVGPQKKPLNATIGRK